MAKTKNDLPKYLKMWGLFDNMQAIPSQTRLQFYQNLKHGKIGEGLIANWLKSRGWHIQPVYEKEMHTGKGPQIYTASNTQLIAPEMLVFNELGRFKWVEAKTKSAFSWNRVLGVWVTGIDLRHYKDYLEVSRLSTLPVCLMFLHLDGEAKDTPSGMVSPTGLYYGEITYLSKNESHRSDKWANGMVYWGCDTLKKIADLHEVLSKSNIYQGQQQVPVSALGNKKS